MKLRDVCCKRGLGTQNVVGSGNGLSGNLDLFISTSAEHLQDIVCTDQGFHDEFLF